MKDAMRNPSDPSLHLSASARRANRIISAELQGRLHNIAPEALHEATELMNDCARYVGAILRDYAAQASKRKMHRNAARRITQSQELDIAITDIKRTATALAPNSPSVQVLYLRKAVAAILGIGSSNEEAAILREAARNAPRQTARVNHPQHHHCLLYTSDAADE